MSATRRLFKDRMAAGPRAPPSVVGATEEEVLGDGPVGERPPSRHEGGSCARAAAL